MALTACKECKSEISTKAKACPKCGAPVPRTKWWLWAPLGFVVFVYLYGAMSGSMTTTDLARMEMESCIRNKGDGDWRGSGGLTLEEFCKGKGALIGLRRACEIDPSKC